MALVTKTIGTATHESQTGTLTSMSAGTTAIIGSGTNFDPEFTTVDRLLIEHAVSGWHSYEVSAVADDTHLTIAGGLVEAVDGEIPYTQGSLRHYSTMTLWAAALGGAAGGVGDDAIGQCYNDSTFDEQVTITNTDPDSITLTAADGEEHDGTAGTGVRIVRTGAGSGELMFVWSAQVMGLVSWLELDANSQGVKQVFTQAAGGVFVLTARNNLFHGQAYAGETECVRGASGPLNLLNTTIFNVLNNGGGVAAARGVNEGTGSTVRYLNVTVHDIESQSTSGSAACFENGDQVQNCIATDPVANGTATCYVGSPGTEDHNLSSDTSASGTGSLTEKTSANQFISNSAPYDLHLKSGADAITTFGNDADLGTTPPGVQYDIDGRDRDAEGDIWDIGAHQFVAVAPTGVGRNVIIGGGII